MPLHPLIAKMFPVPPDPVEAFAKSIWDEAKVAKLNERQILAAVEIVRQSIVNPAVAPKSNKLRAAYILSLMPLNADRPTALSLGYHGTSALSEMCVRLVKSGLASRERVAGTVTGNCYRYHRTPKGDATLAKESQKPKAKRKSIL
jgi:hypothetical protein